MTVLCAFHSTVTVLSAFLWTVSMLGFQCWAVTLLKTLHQSVNLCFAFNLTVTVDRNILESPRRVNISCTFYNSAVLEVFLSDWWLKDNSDSTVHQHYLYNHVQMFEAIWNQTPPMLAKVSFWADESLDLFVNQ